MKKNVTSKSIVFSLTVLFLLTANTGVAQNYFAGNNAGAGNTGTNNTAVGGNAFRSSNSGVWNTAMGCSTLYSNKTGSHNVAVGFGALQFNVNGAVNTAIGRQAMYRNVSGNGNTAVGNYSLTQNTTGSSNIAIGSYAGYYNVSGNHNVSVGNYAMHINTNGEGNTAMGSNAMYMTNGSTSNSAFGYSSLYSNTTGNSNTAMGRSAMYSNTTGASNVAIGSSAADTYTSYSQCTFLGSASDASVNGLVNATAIGYGAIVNGSNRVRVGNTAVTSIGGQVGWTTLSDRSLKTNINKSTLGLEFIKLLNPVTYNYKADGQKDILYTGLIAQELDEAATKSGVAFSAVDKNSEYWGIRYGELTVPLIKAVQEMDEKNNEKISSLQKEIESLKAALKNLSVLVAKSNIEKQAGDRSTGAILFQNEPNPFSNTSVMRYFIADKFSNASIALVDFSGRIIKQYAITGTGEGKITIQAGDLSSGTYTCVLSINGIIASAKKISVLK